MGADIKGIPSTEVPKEFLDDPGVTIECHPWADLIIRDDKVIQMRYWSQRGTAEIIVRDSPPQESIKGREKYYTDYNIYHEEYNKIRAIKDKGERRFRTQQFFDSRRTQEEKDKIKEKLKYQGRWFDFFDTPEFKYMSALDDDEYVQENVDEIKARIAARVQYDLDVGEKIQKEREYVERRIKGLEDQADVKRLAFHQAEIKAYQKWLKSKEVSNHE